MTHKKSSYLLSLNVPHYYTTTKRQTIIDHNAVLLKKKVDICLKLSLAALAEHDQ